MAIKDIKSLNEALDVAYEAPKDLLGYAKCTFVSTTNSNFNDRVNLEGSIRFSGSTLQFISAEPFLRGSMRTSYVVSISHSIMLVPEDGTTKVLNEVTVNTRNSTYTFELTEPDGLVEFSWEMPKDLKEAYEELLSKYYGL